MVRPDSQALVVRAADDGLHRPLLSAAGTAAAATAAEGALLTRRGADARKLAGLREQGIRDVLHGPLAFLPRFHDEERASVVHVSGAIVTALTRHTQQESLDVAFFHLFERNRLELASVSVHVLEARSLWAFERDKAAADVGARRELRRHGPKRGDCDSDQHAEDARERSTGATMTLRRVRS